MIRAEPELVVETDQRCACVAADDVETPKARRSVAPGAWNGAAPITFAHQWQRCDSRVRTAQTSRTRPRRAVPHQATSADLARVVTVRTARAGHSHLDPVECGHRSGEIVIAAAETSPTTSPRRSNRALRLDRTDQMLTLGDHVAPTERRRVCDVLRTVLGSAQGEPPEPEP
jgi:hypothetical protein